MAGTLKVGGNTIVTHTGVEGAGTVTLAHDIIDGNSSYGFAQLKLSSVKTYTTNVVWDVILGDTTNITKPNNNHVIRLGIAGIYLIIGNFTYRDDASERAAFFNLRQGTGEATDQYLAQASDSITYTENNDTYASGTLTYVSNFAANTDIYFSTVSYDNDTKEISSETHASIVLLRKTS
tara:strand:- start:293 stop:829 length:537 start_codon:yes stop_codon:yes gene_type:complete